jgi:Helix-turn-helix domain
MEKDRIEMSRGERDVLKVMALVLKGERTQEEASRLLKRSVRQIRRLQRRLEKEGDGGLVHRLRGKPSNHRLDASVREAVLKIYRRELMGFGPTLAWEKLTERGHKLSSRSLHLWLVQEGLWQVTIRRDRHRSRRERRACFGEMVQADGSEHDWLEGRGPRMVLVGMIDDASNRVMVRFYPAETTEAYMDLLGRWLRKHGRPLAWYSDRDSIFRAESKEDRERSVPTQFSRALSELGIELILANSPQAKGRVERLWGTLQDRWVKELRLAKVSTMAAANDLLDRKLLTEFNRRFTVKPASGNDAHRALGSGSNLPAILSCQEKRTVANDYTIRFANQVYQLSPPAWPGERGGQVTVEKRLDGTMVIRFKERYLAYEVIKDAVAAAEELEAPPPNPRSLPLTPIPAGVGTERAHAKDRADGSTRSAAVHRPGGRSGRTPALPYPPAGKSCGSGKDAYRPAPNHPWRNGR